MIGTSLVVSTAHTATVGVGETAVLSHQKCYRSKGRFRLEHLTVTVADGVEIYSQASHSLDVIYILFHKA